jgi:hypothetical protein
MIGLGQGLTSNSIVLRRCADVPMAVPYRLTADEAIAARLSQVKDGVEIAISAPARWAGVYRVVQADIDAGLPIWIVAPTVVETAPRRWAVNDDGLLLHPTSDSTLVHIRWELNGAAAGTGTTFASEGLAQIDAEVAMVARAASVAGSAELRTVVVEAKRYAANTVVYDGSVRLSGTWGGASETRRLAILWSGTFTGTQGCTIFKGRRSAGKTPVELVTYPESRTGRNAMMVRYPVRSSTGTETDFYARNLAPKGLVPAGVPVICLYLMEEGKHPMSGDTTNWPCGDMRNWPPL